MTLHVIEGEARRAHEVTNELAERMLDLIYEYDGKITVAAALGVLQIVSAQLLEDAHD